MTDILIDTNILMHANNTLEPRQEDCIKLIAYLLNSNESICIDEAVDVDKSLILHEYFDNLKTHGTTGRNFIEKLLRQKRFNPISRQTDPRIARIINQHMNRDKHVDKVFLKIAVKSTEKTIVSHDYEDFQAPKREYFRRNLDLDILDADQALIKVTNN